jgi:hypothetical protein
MGAGPLLNALLVSAAVDDGDVWGRGAAVSMIRHLFVVNGNQRDTDALSKSSLPSHHLLHSWLGVS